MPMLVCSDEEFNIESERLGLNNSTARSEIVVDINRGRTKGKLEVDNETRKIIASEAIAGISVEEIRKEYNISPSSISAYKVGATSTKSYHNPDTELKKNNNNVRADISARAESKIKTTLDLLTEDKIGICDARNIAGIAKDLSAIVKNISPEILNQQNNQVVIFRPRMKEEDDYEIIDVL